MSMGEKNKIKFLKKNYQLIYSLALIIFIPLAIIFNTLTFTSSFKASIDQELYNKAIAIGKAINATSLDVLGSPAELQTRLERLAAFDSEITNADIFSREGESFRLIASLDKELVGTSTQNLNYLLAWSQNQPVAYLTTSQAKSSVGRDISFKKQTERFWVVTMPLKNELGEKSALLSLKVSLKIMDDLTQQILMRSYIILALTILIIVLLLANNARLFEYASLYRKLKEVDQMKDEFISMASHELRTPVTGLRGYISMMLDGSLGQVADQVRNSLEIMKGSSDRLAVLVEDLLDVSRIEQGRMKIELIPTQINPLIDGIIAELKIQADQKKLTLAYGPAADLPDLSLDSGRFKQVLINLIGNAIKYTEHGGVEIVSEYKQKENIVEIRIKDTGIGMSAKARERLFEKFYRVQNDKTKVIPGTGLGLWITKQIVELMNGRITVDSIENVGTQITLSFQVAKKG